MENGRNKLFHCKTRIVNGAVSILYPKFMIRQSQQNKLLDGWSVYDDKISVVPQIFESKNASRYLAAIELLSKYKHAKYKLGYVIDWLNHNRNENGNWDMGNGVKDKVYFPLSDDWRKKEIREADCTERITNLINELAYKESIF